MVIGDRLLKLPPTVRQEAFRRLGRAWRVGIAIIATVLCLTVVFVATGLWFGRHAPPRIRHTVIVSHSLLFLIAMLLSWRLQKRIRSHIRDVLREREYRFCTACLYDLTGHQPEGVCPECGRAFSPDLLRAAWLTRTERS